MHLISKQAIDALVDAVAQMRHAQREYFSSRNHSLLTRAKGLEAKVDRMISAMKKGDTQGESSQQMFPFSEED